MLKRNALVYGSYNEVLNSWLIMRHVRMDLLVRATFKVVPLEVAMSRFFLFCLLWVVLLECITSNTDSTKFKVRLLDKTGVPPCYK